MGVCVCVIGFMMIIVNATDEDSTSKDEAPLINGRRKLEECGCYATHLM